MKKYLSPEAELLKYEEAQPMLEASAGNAIGEITDFDLVEDSWD